MNEIMNETMISPAIAGQLWEGAIPRDAKIGHVHLKVANLERATAFYRDLLGFKVTLYGPSIGLPAVFMAAGDYHHHVALNTFHSAGGTPPPVGHTGLYHFAIVYPDALSLARAVARILKCGHRIDEARDHGATLSVYFRDLDGNGIELYYDRPRDEWFDSHGRPIIKSEPFDVKQWLESIWSDHEDITGRKRRVKGQAA
jgi:catechol 2,3-dioxygenase